MIQGQGPIKEVPTLLPPELVVRSLHAARHGTDRGGVQPLQAWPKGDPPSPWKNFAEGSRLGHRGILLRDEECLRVSLFVYAEDNSCSLQFFGPRRKCAKGMK